MKANELRVDNLIKFGELQHECKPCDILNLYQSEIAGREIGEYKPIPLTEEWLLKFGFYYLDDDNEYLAHPVLIEALKLNSDSSDFFKTCTLRIHKNLTIGVQYVHQLQNLYFALTGEELTLAIKTIEP